MFEKVIFLDIDGVLNCDTSKSHCGIYLGIDKDKVQRLARIVEETNADIVLSSDWKEGWQKYYKPNHRPPSHVKYLNNHLYKKGKLIIKDKTPDINIRHRGAEITKWLENHPETKAWVVLDDVMFGDYFENPMIMNHFIWTNHARGLTDEDVEEAINILKE